MCASVEETQGGGPQRATGDLQEVAAFDLPSPSRSVCFLDLVAAFDTGSLADHGDGRAVAGLRELDGPLDRPGIYPFAPTR